MQLRKIDLYASISAFALFLGISNIALGAESSSSSVSASDSQASNSSFSAEVNSQTGQVSITMQILKLSGVTSEMDIDLSIKNSGIDKCIYNLPVGWSMDIPFIDTDAGKVYPSPGENYIIDDTKRSGLKYYTSRDLKFIQEYGTFQGTPYYYKIIYKPNKNSTKGSTIRYFDFNGKYIGYQDRFGNYITLSYSQVDSSKVFNAYNAQLESIRDSYGQTIKFSASGSAENWSVTYTATMPDGRTATAKCQNNILTITTTTGRVTKATFENSHLVQIDYDTGGRDTYEWSDNAIPYSYNNLSSTGYIAAVTKVSKDPTPDKSSSGDEMITKYNYCVDGQNNYTGYGLVDFGSGTSKDALMESQDTTYSYLTSTTQHRTAANGGEVTGETNYNFLHLPTKTSSTNGSSTLMESTYTYHGQTDDGNFPKDVNDLNCIYSKTKEVTDYYYGGSAKREHKVLTKYDDWGNNTSMTEYNNGSVTSITTQTYDNENYGQTLSQTLSDEIEGTTTTQSNSLSSDGKYIASSATSMSSDSSNGKTLQYGADSYGRPTTQTTKFTSSSNASGNPNSSTSTTSYSVSGNSLIKTTTDALGNSSSEEADIRNGNITKQTDAKGNSVKYTYSNNGLTVTTTYPDGTWKKTDGTNPNLTTTTYSSGKISKSYLDGYGRTYKQTDNLGANGAERVTSQITYNELGKTASETDMYGHTTKYNYDWQGRQIYAEDYLGNITKAEYSDVNQHYHSYYNGIQASTSYYDDNGNTTSQINYLGGNASSSKTPLTTAKYNGKEQEISSSVGLSENGSTSGTTVMSSTSTYDTDENLLTSALSTNDNIAASSVYTLNLFGDIVSRSTEFTSIGTSAFDKTGSLKSDTKYYDANGNLIKYVSRGGKTTTYSYDANGNVISMTDPAGKTITYSYDNMGNMTKMTTPTFTLTNEYYGSGSGKAEGQIKSKALSSSSGGTLDKITYGYDAGNGQINSISYNDGKTMTATYDGYGRAISITDFAGVETTITYDSSIPTNITKVSNKYGSVSYSYYSKSDNALFGAGNTVKQITYSNGVKVLYTYTIVANKAPQLSLMETFNSEGKMMNSTAYGYDAQNRITMMRQKSDVDANNLNSNNIKKFAYDGFDHLTKEEVTKLDGTVIMTTTFKYDLNGNIIKKSVGVAN